MSDTYYIRAFHNNRKLNIPIEEKHFYMLSEGSMSLINKLSTDATTGQGYEIDISCCDILMSSNWVSLPQGTSEGERIGEKVQIKTVDMTLAITWNKTFIKKWFGVNDSQDFSAMTNTTPANTLPGSLNMRLMCVQFDSSLNGDTGNVPGSSSNPSSRTNMREAFTEWFRSTYIYYNTQTGAGGENYIHQSVHQSKLRESTKYTGTFKILYDKKFKIKTSKDIQMEVILPIKKNVNVDSNNKITHESFKNIYWVLLGPACYDIDISPNVRAVLSDAYDGGSTSTYVPIVNTESNFKFTYYDL